MEEQIAICRGMYLHLIKKIRDAQERGEVAEFSVEESLKAMELVRKWVQPSLVKGEQQSQIGNGLDPITILRVTNEARLKMERENISK